MPVGVRLNRSAPSTGNPSRIELDENAREVRGLLYCQPCHGKLDLSVCAACRRLIDDRVVSALGQQWHVEVSIDSCHSRCNHTDTLLLSSISAVHAALNRFVAADISNTRAWRTARPITISCLAQPALSAIGSLRRAVSDDEWQSLERHRFVSSLHGVQ